MSGGSPRLGRVVMVASSGGAQADGGGRRGAFVVFEGGDGAGKSTQVQLLVEALVDRGVPVLRTRQPGGTPLGNALRDLVLHGDPMSARAEALLFAADKAQHVADVIEPALSAGTTVVCDRYVDSSVAYQGAGRGLGADEVERVQDWAVGGLAPDLTVVVDVTPDEGRRRRGQVHDRLEAEGEDFHAAIRTHFLDRAAAHPTRYLVVDGTLDPQDIHARVLERLVADRLIGTAT